MMNHDAPGLQFPKHTAVNRPRGEHKRAKHAAAKRADDAARAIAWIRCGGRCERCGARIKRDGSLLHGAEFNHTAQPREGGRRVPRGEWICKACHRGGPSGGHRRTR